MRPICNNGGVSTGTIPFMGGRPVRDLVINDDDITNLVIAMNTAVSLEEFLALV